MRAGTNRSVRSHPHVLIPAARLLRILAVVCAAVCFVLTTGVATLHAQSATLRGFVTSGGDGQPLPGVNVIATHANAAPVGVATDRDGFYALSRITSGTVVVRATFIGFEPFVDTLALAPGITALNITLEEATTSLDELVVQSDREAAGAAGITAGLQTVRSADIELVPMPDVSADLVNYLTTLPGVVSQGDRGGQLFIRGGEPTQNMVLLDGMPIYQPFHFLGFYSAFPAEIISTADVYAGGFGGRYGGRLSSVIDVSARTGNKARHAGAVSVAPFLAAARAEGPIVRDDVSYLASWRTSMIEQIASRVVDAALPFRFSDRFGKLHATLGGGAQLSVTVLHTTDTGRLGPDPLSAADVPEEDEARMENLAVGARLIFLPPDINLFGEVLVSRSRVESSLGPPGQAHQSSTTTRSGVDVHATQYYGALDLNWGAAVHLMELEIALDGLFQNVVPTTEFVTETALYVEPVYRAPYGLRIEPSMRLQAFPSKGRSFIEPRLRAVWSTGVHRFSGAAGVYHQEVVGLNDRRNVGNVFTAWTSSPRGLVPRARHVILGWRANPASWLDVSVEGFHKRLDDLMVPEWTAFPRFTSRLQEARGRVRGVDARAEITAGPFYAAAGYGYAAVDYYVSVPALQIVFGEEETRYAPPHDRKHQLSLLGSVSLRGFDLSARWQFGSGLPFSTSMGFDRFVLMDSLVHVAGEAGMERVLYQRPYTGRLPTYHRLDVTLEYTRPLSDGIRLTAQAGLVNVYDRLNLFYLDLFTLRRVDQLPLIPSVGLRLGLN
ncbi:MAG: TonB-dependent receptor [Rhodothermales bacterium]